MTDDERKNVARDFREAVNMAPAELKSWLESEESKSVGWGTLSREVSRVSLESL